MPKDQAAVNRNQPWIIQPGEATVFKVYKGDSFRVTDIAGSQVADVIAVSLDDVREKVSTSETMNLNFSFQVPVGGYFYTNKRRAALQLVRDDSGGAHDLTNACCSPEFYEKWANQKDHANCRDAFDAEFLQAGVDWWELPDPINLFQVTKRGPDGSFIDEPSGTAPGTAVEMTALSDLWVGVSCCPCGPLGDEKGSITGDSPTPIEVEILNTPGRED